MPSVVRSTFALLALIAGCGSDFQSLDDAMKDLVRAIPTTLEVAAEDTMICPGSCFDSSSAHRLDLVLAPAGPATRELHSGDTMDITGTFRLTRVMPEGEELLAEGPLTKGRVLRPVAGNYSALVSLSFDLGTLHLMMRDGEQWDAPSLTLRRED